ncbi:MAG: helicase-related protein [Parvularculaceae bacterium]|nr:helicase-related protein [Parvularculaceae bacterium]
MTGRKLKAHEIDVAPERPRPSLVGVLGPTNTGKTYFAIERMLAHPTGLIGLPLRLLAREVYDRLIARRPKDSVALVTGEEKIVPPRPAYWVSTVEAMPLDRPVDFVAVDEIQLSADPERGRIFTSRLLNARGLRETLLLGSETMRPILKQLFPEIVFVSRERFSQLAYAGPRKVTRMPRRTAVVGFSADTVYAIAELVRRQRGGAAVVLGALSPRTRNAQAELYQSGEVDYLVATDAIGMGLNMDIDHVAFAAARKFDGRRHRYLYSHELAQVAGRAGRHIRDGSFGETAECEVFDEATVDAIVNHRFDPVETLQWRSEALDHQSIAALKRSLEQGTPRRELVRARPDEDEEALARLSSFDDVAERATTRPSVELLWEVCQVPDFRKSSFDQHIRLLNDVFNQLHDRGTIGEAWLLKGMAGVDRTDGDIDTISARIAQVRTWTYLSNRPGWLENAAYWQGKTREIEDALSDALHEKLTQRFVDRRTSILLKKLRDEAPLLAGVTEDGDVIVEGQFVGRLLGFEFIVDPRAKGPDAKRMRGAAERALAPTLAARAAALAEAPEADLQLKDDGAVWWRSSRVAELRKGPSVLRPDVAIRGLDSITPNMRGRVADRLSGFVAARIEVLLSELIALKVAADSTGEAALSGQPRGIAYRLVENFGAMSRAQFGDALKSLSQEDRSKLRKLGVRFGEYTLHMPSLLKPAAARMMALLWAVWSERDPGSLTLPKPGLVSYRIDADVPHAFVYALGYRPSGERAVRIDMLERVAQLIRTARTSETGKEGFEASAQMMSLVGCSGEEFESILRSLGYRKQTIKRSVAKPASAPVEPVDVTVPAAAEDVAVSAPVDSVVLEEAQAMDPVEAVDAPPADILVDGAVSFALETAEIEVTVWRMAPRRPPQEKRPPNRENRPEKRADGERKSDGRPPRDNRNSKGKPPRKFDKNPEPRRFSSEPRRNNREPDPNSPFAVLAALKANLGGADPKS